VSRAESRYDCRPVSQSWDRAPSGTHGQGLVLYEDYCFLCLLGAPSLTRGWVCHLSEVSVFVICACLYRNIDNSIYTGKYVQYAQDLCQSRLCEADYDLSYLTYAMTTAGHLNGSRPDRRQV
jgi:hypothetical protein